MTEISAKSVSDVHGIIQNYEIENNSKFRVVKKDVNFGNDGKGIQGFQSGPVPGTFTRLRSCIVPAEITEPPQN
jgi:hypothetical protein